MTAATLFSGIGAPELAMPDWTWLWHAEIEKFPSAVMADRFPHSVNLGDVAADDFCDRALAVGRPDVLVFGSPCQSFSVAGKRLGLDDPRGNLALVALGLVARLRPRWFVFENVPGLLSSAKGSDFGLFLRAVEECGYSGAWAVLDAQHFGVAQRRRRVFVVGHAGDWRGPTAVLLEPESVCGDSAPRRGPGESIAPTIAGSSNGGGANGPGRDADSAPSLIVEPINETRRASVPVGFTYEIAPCIDASGCGFARAGDKRGQDPVVAVSLLVSNAEGSDGFTLTQANIGKHVNNQTPLVPVQLLGGIDYENNGHTSDQPTGPLLKGSPSGGGRPLPAVAFAQNQSGELRTSEACHTLNTNCHASGRNAPMAQTASGVRRLTPVECERLQGMPDGHTAITYRHKPAADGPRYKAIGNSMAVPVVRWILRRIEIVDALLTNAEREGAA